MDVNVRHRLTPCLANIDTDVVTIRIVLLVDDGFHFIDQRPDGGFFFSSRLEVFSNMPSWNNQAMSWVDRVAVVVGKSQLIFDNNLRVAAKGAVLVL